MQRYKILTGIVAAAALLISSSAIAAAPKVGVIDVNYVISQSKRGEAASDALQALLKKKQASLNEEKTSLAATQKDLEGVENKKTDQFKQQLGKFRQSRGEFQQHVQKSKSEVQQRRAELYKPIIADLKKVLKDYADDHGYTLILNKTTDAVAFAADSYNINDEIVKALDQYEGE